jgi:hypothetical protein
MSLNDLFTRVEQLNETYLNETLSCQQCILGTTLEKPFVDCNFPELINLTLTDPQPAMFNRCKFPKLRQVICGNYEKEAIFLSSDFSSYMESQLDCPIFANCKIVGDYSDQHGYLYESMDEYEWHAQ